MYGTQVANKVIRLQPRSLSLNTVYLLQPVTRLAVVNIRLLYWPVCGTKLVCPSSV